MKIGILLICTGRYITFFDQLYTSFCKYFLKEHDKKIYLFTDSDRDFPSNVEVIPIERQGFPGDTYYRYHYFLKIKEKLIEETDILLYIDIDSRIVHIVDDAILPSDDQPLMATLHPGFYKIRNREYGTPETNKSTTAYIDPNIKRTGYICGGFQGGKTKQFLEAAEKIKENIDIDDSNKIMANWNDESHWNCYYVHNQEKYKILSPSYMFPEGWNNRHNLQSLTPKILALNKNHSEIRKPL